MDSDSTQEALLSVSNDWHLMLSKHRQVVSIFFDAQKAFDSVPHDKLLQSHIGVCGPLLQWLTNYLENRHQHVVLDGESSSLVSVSSGVPQGSMLGPLLFIIFMNSITDLPLSSGAKLIIIIIIIMSFTAKIGSEKHNGDEIDGRMLADRLLL